MLNFFPEVLASNPGETISEKGMWKTSVIPFLLYISVTEVAQEIWCMASVEESRRLWGRVVAEDGMGRRLFGTQLSCAFPKVKQACTQTLAKFAGAHALLAHPPWTLCPCAKIALDGSYFENSCWLLPVTQHNWSLLWCWCSFWLWWCFHKAQTFILHLVPLNSAHHSVNTNTSL